MLELEDAMHKHFIAVAGGVAVVVFLRNMLKRLLDPLLASLKLSWPA